MILGINRLKSLRVTSCTCITGFQITCTEIPVAFSSFRKMTNTIHGHHPEQISVVTVPKSASAPIYNRISHTLLEQTSSPTIFHYRNPTYHDLNARWKYPKAAYPIRETASANFYHAYHKEYIFKAAPYSRTPKASSCPYLLYILWC